MIGLWYRDGSPSDSTCDATSPAVATQTPSVAQILITSSSTAAAREGRSEEHASERSSLRLRRPRRTRASTSRHLSRAGDAVALPDARQPGVLLPVVESPVDEYLDEGRSRGVGGGSKDVGIVGIHQAGLVSEAVFREKGRSPLVDLPHRASPSDRTLPARALERIDPSDQDLLLLLGRERGDGLVQVSVVGDLVPALHDRSHDLWVAVRGEARNEERRTDAVSFEDRQDPRDPDERAVGLMRHDREPTCGIRRVEQD